MVGSGLILAMGGMQCYVAFIFRCHLHSLCRLVLNISCCTEYDPVDHFNERQQAEAHAQAH